MAYYYPQGSSANVHPPSSAAGLPPNQQQIMYADATKRHFPSAHPSQPQQLHQQAQAQPVAQQYYQNQAQSQLQSQNQNPNQLLYAQSQAFPPQNQGQLQNQHYGGGYNPDTTSMPPPSTMPSMNMNAGVTMQPGMTQRPQAYQPHVRSNSQQMSPSSPGFLQSPTAFGTPPPNSTNAQYFGQPTLSPTKQNAPTSVPNSQNMMGSSPQPGQTQQRPQNTPPAQKPILQPPLSDEAAKQETQRVGMLLDINQALLQEIVLLQQAGRAGPPPKPGSESSQAGQASPTTEANPDGKDMANGGEGEKKKQISSREYIECMRRLQANLAYLAAIVDRPHRPPEKIPERPAIMEALPNIPGNTISEESQQGLKDLYKSLRDLWPDVGKGSTPRPGQPPSPSTAGQNAGK